MISRIKLSPFPKAWVILSRVLTKIQRKWSRANQTRGGHIAVGGTAIRFHNRRQVYIAITGRCAINMRPERDEFDAGSSHVLDGLLGVVFVSLPLVIAWVQCTQG
jgi:hypothetical protein